MSLREAVDFRSTGSGPFIDWPSFWSKDHTEAEWVFEDVLARGRGHALYAPSGSKKSLFALWLAVQIAVDLDVVYLDYEMTEDDLQERLEDMGHGSESDLSRLHYALLPELPPLDSKDGAEEVELLLAQTGAQGVIIDTTARAVEGEENSADTIRRFAAHTGMVLRRHGVTWLRLDHTGKDLAKGQRGSKAKDDDPDVVWQLRETENGVQLTAKKRRMGWVPEKVTFALREGPLRFVPVADDWPEGTEETATLLDSLSVAFDASIRTAQRALRDAGSGRRYEVIRAALKWRNESGIHPRIHFPEDGRDSLSDSLGENQ